MWRWVASVSIPQASQSPIAKVYALNHFGILMVFRAYSAVENFWKLGPNVGTLAEMRAVQESPMSWKLRAPRNDEVGITVICFRHHKAQNLLQSPKPKGSKSKHH